MREGEIELMTHDVLSSVSVLDVEAPAVTQLLTAAGCDVASVAAYCRNIAQTSQNPAQDAPQDAPQDARPALRLVADTARGFRAQITADVEPAYRALPPSTLATVRAAAPPGLFRCRVAAHALAPATPSLSRVPVCTQCQRPAPVDSVDGSSTGSAKCATCGTPLETRRVLQLRIGDRTGLLDVLVCDPPSVVCSFLFLLFLFIFCMLLLFSSNLHTHLGNTHTHTNTTGLAAGPDRDGGKGRVELCARVAAADAGGGRGAVPRLRARRVHGPRRHHAAQARRHRVPRVRLPSCRLSSNSHCHCH